MQSIVVISGYKGYKPFRQYNIFLYYLLATGHKGYKPNGRNTI